MIRQAEVLSTEFQVVFTPGPAHCLMDIVGASAVCEKIIGDEVDSSRYPKLNGTVALVVVGIVHTVRRRISKLKVLRHLIRKSDTDGQRAQQRGRKDDGVRGSEVIKLR